MSDAPSDSQPADAKTLHPALNTRVCELLGVRYPIVQTGMGWVSGARLTAATSAAGGFGILATVTMTMDQMRDAIQAVKEHTPNPFGVNFRPDQPDLDERLAHVTKEGVKLVSFAGAPSKDTIAKLHDRGISSCTLSVKPSIPGLPISANCPGIEKWPNVFIPANTSNKAVRYTFRVSDIDPTVPGSGTLKSKPVVVTVAAPPPATYVALGDSYSAGEGNPGKAPTPWLDRLGSPTTLDNGCDRSAVAYPVAVTKWLKSQNGLPSMSLRFLACSGATTEDLWDSGAHAAGFEAASATEPQQLLDTGDLSAARIVTVTIGGNDLGFANILYECSLAPAELQQQIQRSFHQQSAPEHPQHRAVSGRHLRAD